MLYSVGPRRTVDNFEQDGFVLNIQVGGQGGVWGGISDMKKYQKKEKYIVRYKEIMPQNLAVKL